MILNNRLKYILLTIPCVLLIPFIAMQFTNEVNWGILDFIIAAVLLLGTAILIEFVVRKVANKQKRIILLVIIIALLLLTWIELAVGIFGTPIAGS